MCFWRQLCIKLLFMNLVLIKLVFNETHDYTPYSHTLSRYQFTQSVKLHSHQLCFFPKLSNHSLMKYKCIVLHFPFIVNEPSFLVHSPLQFLIFSHTILSFFPFQAFKLLLNGPQKESLLGPLQNLKKEKRRNHQCKKLQLHSFPHLLHLWRYPKIGLKIILLLEDGSIHSNTIHYLMLTFLITTSFYLKILRLYLHSSKQHLESYWIQVLSHTLFLSKSSIAICR